MRTTEILNKIDLAIRSLYSNDLRLIQRRLDERNLTTKLGEYLQPLFNGYNVDCEYNGDISKPNDKKALEIAANRLREIHKKVKIGNNYLVVPDIIIHIRERNDNNLVVLEIKKDISRNYKKEYDLLKLEHLTIDYLGNHYNYKLGIAIILNTGVQAGSHSEIYFQNGTRKITRDELTQ